jgi:IS30 family transposase
MVNYRRLTHDERYQIEALLNSGLGLREIARQLGKCASTISRELKKGQTVESIYCALEAKNRTDKNRRAPRLAQRKIQGW